MKRGGAGSDDPSDGSNPPGGGGDRPEKRSCVGKGKGRARTPPRLPTPPPEMSDGQGAGRSTQNVVREAVAAMMRRVDDLAAKAEQEAKLTADGVYKQVAGALNVSIDFHTEGTKLKMEEVAVIRKRQEDSDRYRNAFDDDIDNQDQSFFVTLVKGPINIQRLLNYNGEVWDAPARLLSDGPEDSCLPVPQERQFSSGSEGECPANVDPEPRDSSPQSGKLREDE